MAKTKATAARFARLRLSNWCNFVEVDVPLQRRVFLVGPNASGKSNLLDAFRFLSDLVAVGGGFQQAVRQRGGVSSLRCLSARRYSDVTVHVHIAFHESGEWQYHLRFNQDNRGRPVIRAEQVVRDGEVLLARPDDADQQDAERLTQTYLEQVYVNQPFREVVDFFASVRYLHIVPQLVRDPERSVGRQNDPYGGDFLEQVARLPEKTRSARLRRIREVLTIAVPQLKELELWRDPRGTPHLRGKYEHWRPQGAWQTEERFSDGTLRLMGLLWAVLDGNGPLLLEEPELSLHPGVVRYIPQMFARVQRTTGRQIIVSTHSPEMLQDEGIGLDEVLLLLPSTESTRVKRLSDFEEAKQLLTSGVSIAEIAMPKTEPPNVQQLVLFTD